LTKELYTATDTKKVREQILQEQQGKDALTGLDIPKGQAVLDHNHSSQFVRAVLHRQSNVVLGKLENAYTRYLKYWYPDDLSTFLRHCADYLEKGDDIRFIHPAWIKKVQTEFNKLKESDKDILLVELGIGKGSNAKERKDLFRKAILKKQFTFEELMQKLKKGLT
jgi:hypothetical protein